MHPRFAGVPWWGAVLLAITATAIGFAFDAGSGDRELSAVFAVCYALGCLSAVLAVQHIGLFTAVIQPPLLLFVAVPGSYFLFHGGQLEGVKDLAINCGYPLIERFPLMLFISAAVLLIGLGRWYVGLSSRQGADATGAADTAGTAKAMPLAGIVSSVTEKLSGLVLRKPATVSARRSRSTEPDLAAAAADAPPRRRPRPADRPARRRSGGPDTGAQPAATGRARGERRPTKRSAPPRPRPARAAADSDFGDDFGDLDGIMPERPRRPRPPRTPEAGAGEPRRRVRTQPREPRKQPPPERREAASFDRGRPPRPRRRFDDYQPFEDSFEPPKTNGRSTHHPVSRVRYRGSDDDDHRVEHRTRPRPRSTAKGRHSWDYED
ncbi:hypothetical protein FR943_21315 [Mycobacterium sp. TNTM28]|uniref:DUF6542 domain-containing protein n=1 Tax=[Mycobacterium] fortunisiensis TaxID=2600579 RepID=A0ABS6KS33_9MYCO|nr:DUF6542 domain-containing protein [[Mycobacterium] fortunisiensis]MBU9766370.1 hypothetical protein [[Mycobacterium] fortunisiensis]